jgi:hypothetical protein
MGYPCLRWRHKPEYDLAAIDQSTIDPLPLTDTSEEYFTADDVSTFLTQLAETPVAAPAPPPAPALNPAELFLAELALLPKKHTPGELAE